jgi:hypothetical protein
MDWLSGYAVAGVSAPPSFRSVSSTARSAQIDRAYLSTSLAKGGPIVRATTRPSFCFRKAAAKANACLSSSLQTVSSIPLLRVPFSQSHASGGMFLMSGTCLTNTM